jgi:hypothetical protein
MPAGEQGEEIKGTLRGRLPPFLQQRERGGRGRRRGSRALELLRSSLTHSSVQWSAVIAPARSLCVPKNARRRGACAFHCWIGYLSAACAVQEREGIVCAALARRSPTPIYARRWETCSGSGITGQQAKAAGFVRRREEYPSLRVPTAAIATSIRG